MPSIGTQTDKYLIASWDGLRIRAEAYMEARKLQGALLLLRAALRSLGKPSAEPGTEEELLNAMEELKEQQKLLQSHRSTLLSHNLAVHSLITRVLGRPNGNSVPAATTEMVSSTDTLLDDHATETNDKDGLKAESDCRSNRSVSISCGPQTSSDEDEKLEGGYASLKELVAELYNEWDEAAERIGARLAQYSAAVSAWRQWESGLGALRSALIEDRGAIEGLHGVLDTDLIHQVSLDGGSLSDSGISDGGSDWGLSERERRLGALRRLHRQLELALAPGSAALLAITKRMEQAEAELRSLQQACRELVARTAVQGSTGHQIDSNMRRSSNGSSNVSSQGRSPNGGKRKTKRRQGSATAASLPVSALNDRAALKGDHCSAGGPDDDPGSSPKPRPGWAKRVARAALPLQLALVAVFCAACLLEPHCCDSMNTWTMSLAPQLRYVRGPPPV